MKPISIGLLAGLALLLAGPAIAGTEATTNNGSFQEPLSGDSWLKASLSVGYETLHVYRGADSSSGEAIVWESLDLDAFQFLHFNLYNGNSFDGEYGELTPTAYLYHEFGGVTVAAGMIWYHFPGEDGIDSEEYFLKFSRDLGAGFSASAWFSYNARSEGWYHELKLNHRYEINQRLSLESSAALGVSENYRSGGNGLDNLTLSVALPISLTEKLTLRPSLGYAFTLDAQDSDDEAWAGLTLSYRF